MKKHHFLTERSKWVALNIFKKIINLDPNQAVSYYNI